MDAFQGRLARTGPATLEDDGCAPADGLKRPALSPTTRPRQSSAVWIIDDETKRASVVLQLGR